MPKKSFKYSEYKTKEERQEQVKTILMEITKLGLSIQYQPVKDLYAHLRTYIEEGVAVKVNIPFTEIDRTIVGELKIGKNEECVICLQNNTDKTNVKQPNFFLSTTPQSN